MFFKRILQNFCRTPPVAASVYKNSFYKDQKKTHVFRLTLKKSTHKKLFYKLAQVLFYLVTFKDNSEN